MGFGEDIGKNAGKEAADKVVAASKDLTKGMTSLCNTGEFLAKCCKELGIAASKDVREAATHCSDTGRVVSLHWSDTTKDVTRNVCNTTQVVAGDAFDTTRAVSRNVCDATVHCVQKAGDTMQAVSRDARDTTVQCVQKVGDTVQVVSRDARDVGLGTANSAAAIGYFLSSSFFQSVQSAGGSIVKSIKELNPIFDKLGEDGKVASEVFGKAFMVDFAESLGGVLQQLVLVLVFVLGIAWTFPQSVSGPLLLVGSGGALLSRRMTSSQQLQLQLQLQHQHQRRGQLQHQQQALALASSGSCLMLPQAPAEGSKEVGQQLAVPCLELPMAVASSDGTSLRVRLLDPMKMLGVIDIQFGTSTTKAPRAMDWKALLLVGPRGAGKSSWLDTLFHHATGAVMRRDGDGQKDWILVYRFHPGPGSNFDIPLVVIDTPGFSKPEEAQIFVLRMRSLFQSGCCPVSHLNAICLTIPGADASAAISTQSLVSSKLFDLTKQQQKQHWLAFSTFSDVDPAKVRTALSTAGTPFDDRLFLFDNAAVDHSNVEGTEVSRKCKLDMNRSSFVRLDKKLAELPGFQVRQHAKA